MSDYSYIGSGKFYLKELGAATAQPTYPTATNPKTGERLMLKDGKWQPMQS